jgi:CheY-like chemotaxis protein
MPNVDGSAAAQRIRALDHPARGLPIIAITANVLPQQIQRFHVAGMNDHGGKPFQRDELYAMVERWGVNQDLAAIPTPEHSLALDESVLEGLREIAGPSGVDHLLRKLAEQLQSFPRYDEGDDLSCIAGAAHKLASSAGMLGFLNLSSACSALEDACNDGNEIWPLLVQLSRERAAALAQLDELAAESPNVS